MYSCFKYATRCKRKEVGFIQILDILDECPIDILEYFQEKSIHSLKCDLIYFIVDESQFSPRNVVHRNFDV